MLRVLRIENVAVVREAELQLGEGLTVLTGETGAGKSILIDALGLLLGARADGELIRSGSDQASVEAVLEKTELLDERLEELGLPDLGEELSLRRVVTRSSKGKVYVNGALVTAGVLARLMRGVIDISGQHDSTGMLDPSVHRRTVDRMGGLGPLLCEYKETFASLVELDRRIAQVAGSDQEVLQRAEFLQFQLDEIERVDPRPDEEAGLVEEKKKLSSVERIKKAAGLAEALLSGQDGAALELGGRALAALNDAAKSDLSLNPLIACLQVSLSGLDETTRGLSRYARQLESDPRRLAEVEERLDAIHRLCRKHACNMEGVLARKKQLAEELRSLKNCRELNEALQAERAAVEEAAKSLAERLFAARQQTAKQLSAAVEGGLRALSMPHSKFRVQVLQTRELGKEGIDEVEFLFSANLGEPLRPMAKVASGGEGARVLLALKRALTVVDECACYILDETDAGVGGAVAEVVGRMLKEVSKNRQVLFITHLPQVAAYADVHLLIEKVQNGGRVTSRIIPLQTPKAKAQELARMLSGVQVTTEARSAAEALMRAAGNPLSPSIRA